jgi:hypothetical protein
VEFQVIALSFPRFFEVAQRNSVRETDVIFVLDVMAISITSGHQLNNKNAITGLQTLRKVGPL